jgi:hypothetical protein
MAEPTENKLLAGLAARFERYRAEVLFVSSQDRACTFELLKIRLVVVGLERRVNS